MANDGPWADSYDTTPANDGPWADVYDIGATASGGPGAVQSALEHFGNSATLGYLPQLQAAASRMIPDPAAGTDAKLKAQGFTIDQPESSYLSDRDANIARLAQESKEHPYASAAGTVGGAIVGGVALSPITPIRGATLAARAGQASLIGAGYGALSNPGDTEGQYGGLQAGNRMANGAVGAVAAGAMQPVAEGAIGAAQWAKGAWSDYAADKAAKAIGMTKADYKRMGPDAARALGRAALDQRIVTPLATPASIEATTDTAKEVAGQKLGQVIDQSQAQLDQMGPVGMMRAGPDIEATPVNTGTKIGTPQTQTFYPQNPYTNPIEVPVSAVGSTIERTGPTAAVLTPIQPRPAGSIDVPALAQRLQNNGDAAQLSKIPGMEGLASKINGFIDTLSKNPQDMNLRDAQALRQGIDSAINWGKGVPEMAGTQQYLVNIRNALSDAMSQSVDQAAAQSGAPLGALRQANTNYATLAKINDIAANRASMNAANRAVGLTDTIAGGAGAGVGATIGGYVGGPMGAEMGAGVGTIAGGAINKFGRTFGPSIAATGANRAASLAGSVGNAVQGIANNPAIAQGMLQGGIRQNQQAQDNPGMAPGINRIPARGEDAWAQQGLQKLGIQDQGVSSQLLQDPKAKQLLIQASDLTPGSPAMQRIMSQIQKGFGNKR